MKSACEQVNILHAEYCARSGHDLVLNYQREAKWGDWLAYRKSKPFSLDDLRAVIRYLVRQIADGERKEASLLFRNLIESPDKFEEDLSLARANGSAKRRAPANVGNYKPIPVPPAMTKEETDALLREFGFKPLDSHP